GALRLALLLERVPVRPPPDHEPEHAAAAGVPGDRSGHQAADGGGGRGPGAPHLGRGGVPAALPAPGRGGGRAEGLSVAGRSRSPRRCGLILALLLHHRAPPPCRRDARSASSPPPRPSMLHI